MASGAAPYNVSEDSAEAVKKRQLAEIEDRKNKEREALEKSMIDSVKIVNSRYGSGFLHINRRAQLILKNLSSRALENITVEITLEPGGVPEMRLIKNVKAKSDTVLVDNLSRNSKIGGSVKSVRL